MKSIIIILLTWLFSISLLTANPVSQEEAQKTAISWYTNIAKAYVTDYSVEDVFTVTQDNIVTIYVFNFKSGGFVIVAADNASIPILGYSVENPFPADISCPAVKEWLDDYSLQIKQIVKEGLSNQKTKAQWDAIRHGIYPKPTKDVDPLLTTTWWQGCYYNELCPVDPAGPCGHVPTGCVATAMAQIMKFHSFPTQGVGSYSYTHPVYGIQSVDFGNTIYDWDSMPNNVTSSNIPVATIMYHAGVSVNMDYDWPIGSEAFAVDVIEAFVDYFNYDPGIEWHKLSDYPDPEDWKNLLRVNLDNQLPVFYSGNNLTEGHAFVCDGYNLSKDMFNFNWGWGGSYNGLYAIGNLNPGEYTFDLNNFAIVNLIPDNPELITRISFPSDNFVVEVGSSVEVEAATVYGSADNMKITLDGATVATGTSNNLSYTWNTATVDLGSHNLSAWSFTGGDSVFYPINLNIAEWKTQASGFQTTLRSINYISAVDSNVVWAIAWDGIDNMFAPCQDFTRTTDGGDTWISGTIPNCEDLTLSMICAIDAEKAYVAMYKMSGNDPQGIYVTTDGGNTWTHQATAAYNSVYSFTDCVHFFNENDGWCMGDPTPAAGGFEMYTTNNGGTNWIPVPSANMPSPLSGEYGMTGAYSTINDTIWFGTTKGRIFRSIDKGYTWTVSSVTGMADEWIIPVFRNGSHGLVHNFFNWAPEAIICETFDGGETWDIVNINGPLYQTSLAFVHGTENTWVSTGGRREQLEGKGASVSYDGGHTWTTMPGTEGSNFRNMTWLNNHCGWAGGYNVNDTLGGIFKFIGELPSITTSVQHLEHKYGNLLEVYPNPVSENATIQFTLANTDFVSLSVYDITGKHLETILSEKLTSGKNKTNWNAEGLPSGIYFLRLETNGISETRKLILLK